MHRSFDNLQNLQHHLQNQAPRAAELGGGAGAGAAGPKDGLIKGSRLACTLAPRLEKNSRTERRSPRYQEL